MAIQVRRKVGEAAFGVIGQKLRKDIPKSGNDQILRVSRKHYFVILI